MIDYTYEETRTLSDALSQLYTIVTILRSPGGCPWDRKQTAKSVSSAIVDETYEYIDGILDGNDENMKEELGDVLLNVFHVLSHPRGRTYLLTCRFNKRCITEADKASSSCFFRRRSG